MLTCIWYRAGRCWDCNENRREIAILNSGYTNLVILRNQQRDSLTVNCMWRITIRAGGISLFLILWIIIRLLFGTDNEYDRYASGQGGGAPQWLFLLKNAQQFLFVLNDEEWPNTSTNSILNDERHVFPTYLGHLTHFKFFLLEVVSKKENTDF